MIISILFFFFFFQRSAEFIQSYPNCMSFIKIYFESRKAWEARQYIDFFI